ncbi:MAG: glycosyltransferase [Candidatus Dormiibacterota bacterium]
MRAAYGGLVGAVTTPKGPWQPQGRSSSGRAAGSVFISVVIPTRNSARTLDACLESLLSQCGPGDEVIVVDDVETADGTREICRRRGVVLIVSPAGTAGSRNLGQRWADRSFVMHLDSDMILRPDTMLRIRAVLATTQADALVLPEKGVGTGYWSRARALDKASVQKTGIGIAARVIRKSLEDQLGGHSPNLNAGEDADLHRRLVLAGASIAVLEGTALLHDEGRMSLRSTARKKYHYGLSLPQFEQAHGRLYSRKDMMRRLRVGMVLAIRDDPLALPGFLILKATEAAAGTAGSLRARWSGAYR